MSQLSNVEDKNAETLESALPLNKRTGTVILGRMDFFSVLLRLIGMELYKIHRRLMSKVLLTIAILLALLVPLASGIELAVNLNTPASQFSDVCQGTFVKERPSKCTSSQLDQFRHVVIVTHSEALRLPASLELASTQDELNPAIILLIILSGSLVGGELSIGTVRLMFTRGPQRGQFLLARYGALLVCIVLSVLVMTFVGIIVSQLFNLTSGVTQSIAFLSPTWLGHALLYLLVTMLDWFMFAVVAAFLGMLGRSTVAGVVGALTWFFAEPVLSNILAFAGTVTTGGMGTFLRSLPDYFIINNARSLQLNQAQYLFNGTTGSPLSGPQALITLACYLLIFISLTWLLNESRDVTN